LATVTPETEWPITFNAPDGNNYTVQMTNEAADGAAGTPIFQVFKTSAGSLLAPTADPASSFTPDGTITIIVPRSLIGNPAVGTQLNHFLTRITVGQSITPDNMPNNLTPAGSYTIVGNAFCAPNTAPLASLVAHPVGQPTAPPEGDPPLAIAFDGSGSSDADAGDTIASYTFDFGDGSQPVTQSGATIQHTYNSNGQYAATLKVTDSRGKISNNTGLVDIDVLLPLTSVGSSKLHGTNPTPRIIILPLSGKIGIECRSGGGSNAYTLVYTFERNIVAHGTATKTRGTATVGTPTIGPAQNQVTVPLTGVANAQHLLVDLSGVQDSAGAALNHVTARMDMLVGDTTGDGSVNSVDINQTKSQIGLAVGPGNFREDVIADNSINGKDLSLVKSQSGTALP